MPHTSLSVWATYNLSGQDVPVTTKYTLWQPHNSIAQIFLNLPGWDSTQTTQKSSAWCIRACQWISHNHSMTIPIHIIIYPSLCQAFITTHTSCITDLYSGNMCSVMSWYEPNSSSCSSPCTFPVYAMLTMKTQMSRSGISQEIQINFSHISSFMQSVRAPCCMSNCIIVAAERAKKKNGREIMYSYFRYCTGECARFAFSLTVYSHATEPKIKHYFSIQWSVTSMTTGLTIGSVSCILNWTCINLGQVQLWWKNSKFSTSLQRDCTDTTWM